MDTFLTQTGPPQYRSRTIYEDATPETLKDFFWDDEFRANWDDMLIHAQTLEKCSKTGTMLVQWVRKVGRRCSFSFLRASYGILILFVKILTNFFSLRCSFPSFVATESTSLGVEFGNLEGLIIV